MMLVDVCLTNGCMTSRVENQTHLMTLMVDSVELV